VNSLPPFSHLPAGRYRALGWLALSLATSAAAEADVIATFNEVAARTATPPVAYPAVTPEEKRTLSFVDLATVHLAMYDAVVAIEGGYEPYAIVPVSPAQGASSSAAAAAAACTVLQGLFPNRAPEPRARVIPQDSQGEHS
jgi:hypothetical protein